MTALLANVGTPLMWFSCFHLTVGNALIGLGEGLLVAILMRRPKTAAIAIMVLANYVSMLAGFLILNLYGDRISRHFLGDEPLYHARTLIYSAAAASYLLSIILEWPFVFWIVRGKGIVRSLLGSVAAQTASYAVLVFIYAGVSPMTVYTELRIDRNLTLPQAQSTWVFYIAPDRHVWRIRPDGTTPQCLSETAAPEYGDCLLVHQREDGAGFDLRAGRYAEDPEAVTLLQRFTHAGDIVQNVEAKPYWHPAAAGDWSVYAGFWAYEGLHASNARTGESYRIALETPFLNWPPCNPTLLPGGYVIYSLGPQVVLLDLNRRRIRLVALGVGPVVVNEGPPNNPPQTQP